MSNEQPHDPTVTLRLELGRVTDQRNAFKAALATEVLKVVRVAVIQATIDADNEIARLKAEVERLKEGNDCLGQMHDKEMERSAYLLEEFNRTTAWGRGLESDLSHARVEISFLKAEVKRLSAADSYLQDANEHAFEKRCDELEAEVERLKNNCAYLDKKLDEELDK